MRKALYARLAEFLTSQHCSLHFSGAALFVVMRSAVVITHATFVKSSTVTAYFQISTVLVGSVETLQQLKISNLQTGSICAQGAMRQKDGVK